MSAQRPIGSGFGAQTTAAEVLRGVDLSGRLAIVTGGYSGLGLETTRALTSAGARVVVPARRQASAAEALASIPGVELERLDLADLESVFRFARRFAASGRAADIVIANAGIMASPEVRVGPGWEAQLAVNHLGHFALGWIDQDGRALDPTFKTPEQGAATQVWAATSPQLSDVGGVYCEDCDVAEVVDHGNVPLRGVRRYAVDPSNAARLWALSAELTGIDAFASPRTAG